MDSNFRPMPLPWLAAGEAFPPVSKAWGPHDPAPGLLAGGGDLSVSSLHAAYARGIFPWYSEGQPILWWSPDPRMVLRVANFKLHRSLRKTLRTFLQTSGCEVRIDHDFSALIAACANTRRDGQAGTWIQPEMQAAYLALHQANMAHSVETWKNGRLIGGLYCTAVGAAVFGESMFALETDASKIALCALVALCQSQGVGMIDCQQNTVHLASLGAREMPRDTFCEAVREQAAKAALTWDMPALKWNALDPRIVPSNLP